MDENPYSAPLASPGEPSSHPQQALHVQVLRLRTVATVLTIALVLQWLCHLLTAFAMSAWMNMVIGAPTSKTLDTFFYGFACVGASGVISLGVAGYAAWVLRKRLGTSD